MTNEYQFYYNAQFDEAGVYQDWISDQLRRATPALIIGPYSSKLYQLKKGESFSGIEIKQDKKLETYHNIYFEIAEKSNPANLYFVSSGVYRKDICWLYLIGNYAEVFLFSCRQLCRLYEHDEWHDVHHVKKKETETSKGFIMPREYVMSDECPYLLNHWVFDEEAVAKHHPGQKIQ